MNKREERRKFTVSQSSTIADGGDGNEVGVFRIVDECCCRGIVLATNISFLRVTGCGSSVRACQLRVLFICN